jgi:hypothetical protein
MEEFLSIAMTMTCIVLTLLLAYFQTLPDLSKGHCRIPDFPVVETKNRVVDLSASDPHRSIWRKGYATGFFAPTFLL